MKVSMLLSIVLAVILVGCNKSSSSMDRTETVIHQESERAIIYDPLQVQAGDKIGGMTVRDANIREYVENQHIVDITFDSEVIELTGTFHNGFIDSDPDRIGITFVPDEQSARLIPKHNLFDYEVRLYFLNEAASSLFGTNVDGQATIEVQGYHEIVNYKDDILENSQLIRVKKIL